jgi:biopolymer transport protein ExbD
MPIHAPGPRLGHSIPFKHLAAHGSGKKGVYASLNLTALVDMMTMLVVFLLSTFSATGEIVMSQKGIELPIALNDKELQSAAIIAVSADQISFQGEAIADPRRILDDTMTEPRIVELADRLELEAFTLEKNDRLSEDEKNKLRGLVILQADHLIEAKVLNKILNTARSAKYTDVMFAISRKGGGSH